VNTLKVLLSEPTASKHFTPAASDLLVAGAITDGNDPHHHSLSLIGEDKSVTGAVADLERLTLLRLALGRAFLDGIDLVHAPIALVSIGLAGTSMRNPIERVNIALMDQLEKR
jgi:hypothetical protein